MATDTNSHTHGAPLNGSNTSGWAHTEVQLRDLAEYKAAMGLVIWGLPLVIVFGTIGNALALIVLLSPRMRNTSVNVYLASLAVADTFVLYLSGFKSWLRALTDFELLHVNDAGCRILMFLILLSLHMSAWLVVAVSLDRFVAIWFPFNARILCTPARARISCGVLTLVMVVYNLYAFVVIQLRTVRVGKQQCSGDPDSYFMRNVQQWMKLSTYSCIPFAVVLVLNVCIIFKVLHGCNRNQELRADSGLHTSSRTVQDTRLTMMLIWVALTWLLLTAPVMLWSFIAKPSVDTHSMAKKYLAKIAAFLLMYLNHGLNFYLYCISGRKFREALIHVFTCAKDSQPMHTLHRTDIRLKSYQATISSGHRVEGANHANV